MSAERESLSGCSICHEEEPCAARCMEWAEYWRSLTPEQRRDEERMMAQYVAETERENPRH